MRLKIAADGERFVTEHLVDGEARYAVGRATVVDSDQSSQRGGPSSFALRALRSSDGGGWLFTVRRAAVQRSSVTLCTWRNGRILHSCKIESSNTQHRPVPSPARHQARTMICLGRGAGGSTVPASSPVPGAQCAGVAMRATCLPHPGRLNNTCGLCDTPTLQTTFCCGRL